ncbi:MAG: hypothetical protein Q9169_006787 [Polycauliona sp. 2 TL-2023]
MTPPKTFVTSSKVVGDHQGFVCGALYPYMEHGTLDDQIETTTVTAARLPLVDKAVWCWQMASAVTQTHHVASTFHMDIKPANFLLDARRDLILIDWEQSGAALYSLAPEADGSWDVVSSTPKLVYQKYAGPYRENLAWGRPKWNVFPIWNTLHPGASEAAEVFSLGRTMWVLLEQVPQSDVEDLEQIVVSWSESAKDLPDNWKTTLARCMDPDPNQRLGLSNLVEFWEMETWKIRAQTEGPLTYGDTSKEVPNLGPTTFGNMTKANVATEPLKLGQ